MPVEFTYDPFKLLRWATDFAGVAFAAGTAVFVWRRKQNAGSWPSVLGKVQFGEVIGSPKGPKTAWMVDLSYSFVVQGQYYAGKYQTKARSEDDAYEIASMMKEQAVMVRYATRDPTVSVVLDEDQMSFMGRNLANR